MEKELRVLQSSLEPPPPEPSQTSDPELPGGLTTGEQTATPAGDVGKQEADHAMDPGRIGEAELAKSLDTEVGNTVGAANENSRESKSKQEKKKLTYRDSAHIPARTLD